MSTNVLIVDDKPENLLALELLLAPIGSKIIKASSGLEALQHLLKEDIGCILMDVQMPGLDGYETAKIIRQREKTKNIPIIFITSIAIEKSDVFRGYETGAIDYIIKPIIPEILLSKVKILIELSESRTKLARYAKEQEQRAKLTEEKYKLLIEHAGEAIFVLDNKAIILDSNQKSSELLGIPKPEIIGKDFSGLLARDEFHRFLDAFGQLKATGFVRVKGLKLNRLDGKIVITNFSGTSLGDKNESCIIAIFHDITEVYNAQMALRKYATQQTIVAELGANSLLLNSVDALISATIHSTSKGLNATYCAVMEYLPDKNDFRLKESMGWKESGIPDEAIEIFLKEQCIKTLDSPEPVLIDSIKDEFSYSLLKPFIELGINKSISARIQISNKIFGTIIVNSTSSESFTITDCTFLNQIANILSLSLENLSHINEIAEREKRYELIFHASYSTLWEWDLMTNKGRWLSNISNFYDLEEHKDISLESWVNNIHPEDKERVWDSINKAIQASESVWSDEYRFKRIDGTYGWIVARGYIIKDSSGKPIRIVGAMNDITERHQFVQKLKEQAALLDISPNAIIVCEEGDVVSCWNNGAVNFYGWKKEEALGKKLSDLLVCTSLESRLQKTDFESPQATEISVWSKKIFNVLFDNTWSAMLTQSQNAPEPYMFIQISRRKRNCISNFYIPREWKL